MTRTKLGHLLLAVFASLATTGLAFAQGTDLGTIRGAVTDATSASVPNAQVTVTDVATNISTTFTTKGSGEFEATNLKSGVYKVKVSAPGFNTVELTGINLVSGGTTRADVRLEVGKSTESVTVESTASAVQSDSPAISGTLDNRQLIEIPRDSRDIYQFLYLNPSVVQSSEGDGTFKFIGAQSYGASFSLDGQRTNGGVSGSPTGSQPSLETIGELTILTNNFAAEYAGIANIRVVTKRGEDRYHGSLFYNNRNSALAAWSLTNKVALSQFVPSAGQPQYPTPYFNTNEFGGSFGGKVPKVARTYFMAAYERRYTAQPLNIQNVRLPHASLLAGDFTKVTDAAKPVVPAGINLTPDEIANNTVGGLGLKFTRIPARLINPITSSIIQNYFPSTSANAPIVASTGRLAEYFNLVPQHGQRDLGTIRVDHDFSDNDRYYMALNVQNRSDTGNAVASPFTAFGLIQTQTQDYTVSNSYTKIISPRLVNELRGGMNLENRFSHGNVKLQEFLQSVGFNDAEIKAYGAVVGPDELNTFGHTAITLGAFQPIGNGGRSIYRPLDQHLATFGDTLTWIKGRHALKFGGDIVRNSAQDGFTANRGNPRGAMTYSGTGPDALTRFLLGMAPNSVSYVQALRPPMDVYNWEHGYFGQDEWRVTPRLTLNLGLRYEVITPFVERNDLIVNFDPTFKGTNGKLGRFIVPSNSAMSRIDPRMVAYGAVTADTAGVGRGLVQTDRNNFAPRLGLAWRLTDKSVIRGGFGSFYTTSAAQGIRDAMASAPFNQGITFTNTAAKPIQPWPTASQRGVVPIAGGQMRALDSAPTVNIIPFDLQQARIDQYNFTYEREIFAKSSLRLSYLGTSMHGLIAGIDRNMQAPNDTPFATFNESGTPCNPDDGDCVISTADASRRPFPTLGDYMAQYGNIGHGRSNAFQVEALRRAGNLTYEVSYTLLDQKSSAVDSGNSSLGGPGYNQFNPEVDYAKDAFVSKHRITFYGVYDTPFGRGRKYGASMPKLADAAIGGWQLSWNGFIKSGTGFTPYWTCDNCDPVWPGNIGSGFIDATGGFFASYRPRVVGNADRRSGDRIWDPAAFAVPTVGADLFSNPAVAKRNLLTGPGTWGVNIGVQKKFRLGERVTAALGADANNIFNHPLISPTDTGFANIGSFSVDLNPANGRLLPITRVTPNPNFGRMIASFAQDGIDSRRAIRLRLRISF